MKKRINLMFAIFSFFLFFHILFAVAGDEAQLPELDIQIGQMLMMGFDGIKVTPNSSIVKDIQKYHLGGIILFDRSISKHSMLRNISSPKQLRMLTKTLQKSSGIPLFIAIDQEGGKVDRLKPERGFPRTVSAAYLGKKNSPKLTTYYARQMATVLSQNGINVNFAPVVDLNINPKNPIIGKVNRSFSADPAKVIEQASIFIDQLHRKNVACTLKHFPGHGSSIGDTHKNFVDVSNTWQEKELEPYTVLIEKSPCEFVMVAHVYNKNLDADYPATLSNNTVEKLLRTELGFQGIIITDDLRMAAIKNHYSLRETIKLAVNAGNDILLFGNNTDKYEPNLAAKVFNTFKELVKSGEIKPERVAESYQRIMQLKQQLYGKET